MILVVGGIKGGSGKTTIATNLTILRAATGKKVLLVDADEQQSSTIFSNQRDSLGIETKWSTIQLAGKNLHSQVTRMRDDYDDIIIDVGGRDTTSQRSALAIADAYLIPFRPRSYDVWTIGAVRTLISEMKTANPKLLAYAFINQADYSGWDNEEAYDILKNCQDFICINRRIGNRKAFATAASLGMGVSEGKNQDIKAVKEMQAIHDFLYI